ncbi:fumarylacetoacetate hydrolase family protein [Brevibacterium sp. UCMA 11754]|uniref:fumarylacetoacetate hydrolase family protein n=1 Tax=Brevibacterium sp. UCMA 11754 TaxID=2749198 RepID=UPI001F2B6AD3|nr:fumarylacetoacetate hydrolase family protein [Brevibacterium sp. UCMA 11754]MCF2570617.1 fumarylacetoacetate hydrolase family protein [Brevibacterium sp. UCMA 11754]
MTLDSPFALARFRDNGTTSTGPGATATTVVGSVAGQEPAALGLVAGDLIRALSTADLGTANLNEFLADPDWDRLAALAAEASADAGQLWRPLDSVTLTAPVEPRQVLQAGANYRDHVIELVASGLSTNTDLSLDAARDQAATMMDARAANGEPYIFIGLPSCVVGDDEALQLPTSSDTHDWELELAAVIGKPAFRVSREEALEHVAGFTICNDISTREFTFRKDMKEIGSDWLKSKNSPGFLPTGPFLVPDRFVDPADLDVRLELNGEVKQDANTSDLMFDLAALLSTASQTARLLPGDLLLTGSPAGNGQHWKRFLRDGDVLTGYISGLGTQTIRCVDEPSTADGVREGVRS